MPDVKISELPQASTIGTADIFVLNQGGITKTASKLIVTAGLATTDQIGGLNSAQVQSLTSAQIAAITPASLGAVATSDIIGISKGGTGTTDAVSALSALGGITSAAISGLASTSQLSGFATTDQISGFTNSAQVQSLASAQISAITAASIGAASTSQLSAYVPKAGATMEGKLIMAATTAQAFANIGSALSGVAAPASTVGGDVWVSNQSRLTFSPLTGTAVTLAGLSQANTFNQAQTIGVGGVVTALAVLNNGTGRAATFGAASASTAVSILQTGAGEAFRVEDETSPDATPFVISSTGRVGIGVAPDAVTALSVDSGGIKFADGSIATTALGGAGGLNSAQIQALTTEQLNAISVSAGTGLTGGGVLSASSTLSIAALSPDPTGTYGSTSQIPSLTVNNLGQVTAVSVLSFQPPNVQTFSTVGTSTYTKPAGARFVRAQIWSAGGGGGSGRKGLAGTVRCGGGGGGSGQVADFWFDASVIGATETVTIGAGGAGAASQTTNSTNGINGSAGNTTSFGARVVLLGGAAGSAGTAAQGSGGGGGHGGNTGASASTTGAITNGTPSGTGSTCAANAAGSGAAGGTVTAADVEAAGGSGGRNILLGYLGGAAGVVGGAGGDGVSMPSLPTTGGPVGGSGGGSGGASKTGNAGAGGNGGFPGGGGGGGGGALDGIGNSGAGGNGGSGAAIITTYF